MTSPVLDVQGLTVRLPAGADRVNAVENVSSESLDAGIVTEGLRCLSLLCRYQSDEVYRNRIDLEKGFDKLLERGNAVWGVIKKERLAERWA